MKINLIGLYSRPAITPKNNIEKTNQSLHLGSMTDTVSFKSKVTILSATPEYKKEIIIGEERDHLFGSWFEIIGAKIKSLSTCDVVNRECEYLNSHSKIVDTIVDGDIEADGVSPLIIEGSQIDGDIYSNEEGKSILLDKGTTVTQDLLASSKGYTDIKITDKSSVLGNVVCGNFYENCMFPEILVSGRSKIRGKIIMASDTGSVVIDDGIVNHICFDALMNKSKYRNPKVQIKNESTVLGDIRFCNKRGILIVEDGSQILGDIENADITYVDKKGCIIKKVAKD